ncbi:Spp1p Ecym_8335 [Eremothecium cymbalariae DBVPG|uniref:PHD-type domain-containing protein n=1 Tax=Eremothecium cymbalariae (strain CBS 270.75 / DBVPG 7215 / KCTC 17166 / NRRL Y-17582) TaxID=931890 RepID=G8JXN9_ERECY|nr:Hypothetical protein Ecym_8335 [Eremothecium cymbalariae DBVPG\
MSLPGWCPPYKPHKKDQVTGEDVYCICKKPDGGELMVLCDGCEDWFHFTCVKIPIAYKDLVFSFYCPYCQAGITNQVQCGVCLPKTIWKRKCRLLNCYKECLKNSKYCCSEHGETYMKELLNRFGDSESESAAILKQMLKTANFESLGLKGMPVAKREMNPQLYDQLIEGDKRLDDLQKQLVMLHDEKMPSIKAMMDSLNKYQVWLKDVDKLLFQDKREESPYDLAASKKKGRGSKSKKIKTKSLCGYSQTHVIPCSAEEFVSQYTEESVALHSICCKLRCIKHQDWADIQRNAWEFEIECLENSEQRIQLLINIRKEQLAIQFYESLS